jgi:3-deoxy-D-manno-octulosonate 8-phosphate phosphatase (KDO 8-P phosphatase)
VFQIEQFELIVFDFDGVFTDNALILSEKGEESVRCSRADGLGINMLKRHIKNNKIQSKLLVLSTEINPVVSKRCEKLGLDYVQGIDNKKQHLVEYFSQNSQGVATPWEKILYFGNDLNDLQIMELSPSFAPVDAHPRIKSIATKVFNERGGEGFVRAAIEFLLQVEKMTSEELSELIFDR